jgi:hypothetical protein
MMIIIYIYDASVVLNLLKCDVLFYFISGVPPPSYDLCNRCFKVGFQYKGVSLSLLRSCPVAFLLSQQPCIGLEFL